MAVLKYVTKDVPATLHVIAVKFNPMKYAAQNRLYEEFEKYMESNPNVTFWSGEVTLGNRPHVVTDPSNPRHFQFYVKTILWQKESIINAVLRRIPRLDSEREQYIAWIDADIINSRHDWAEETIHALQSYDIVQPWSTMNDLGPKHEIIGQATSGGYAYVTGMPMSLTEAAANYYSGPLYHPGFSWAARRSALDTIGGLIDWAILGAADHHMLGGLLGGIDKTLPGNISDGYRQKAMQWQTNALKLKKNLGYIDNHLLHQFHGAKRNRFYSSRWDVLVNNKYDPNTDIVYNTDGIPELAGNKPKLRDDIRKYMASRDEDNLSL